MSTPDELSPEVFTISLAPELAAKVKRVAAAENRSISDLFKECFRTYRAKQIKEALDQSNEAFRDWASENGIKEEDFQAEIENAIEETRAIRRQELENQILRNAG